MREFDANNHLSDLSDLHVELINCSMRGNDHLSDSSRVID